MARITVNTDAFKTRKVWTRHKIDSGSNVYRMLPPFGDTEITNGYPFKRWSTVWLLDEETGKQKPVATPFTTGQDCPVREYTSKLIEFIAQRKTELEAQGLSPDKVSDELSDLNRISWQTAVKTIYAYNAVNKSGTVGILELKSTAHKGVKSCFSQYIAEYNQDPTSLLAENDDSGVWIDVRKDGTGKNTEYSAEISQLKEKDANGRLIKIDDRSAIVGDAAENFTELAYNLFSLYKEKEYDELLDMFKYHLSTLNVPAAILPGYELTPIVPAVRVAKVTSVVDEAPFEGGTPIQGKKQVHLNLDEADVAEDDAPIVTSPLAQATAAKQVPVGGLGGDVDIDSLMNDIMNT